MADDLVATVAHTFDDVRTFDLIDVEGRSRSARIVWLDPMRDLALLQVDGDPATWLPLGEIEDGEEVDVITAASADTLEVKSATVLSHVTATLDGVGERAAIEIAADISGGDSGAPLINASNETVGIVFASVRGDDRAWAIAAEEIEAALAQPRDGSIALSCS